MSSDRKFVDRDGVVWSVSEVSANAPGDEESRERRAEPRSGERPASEAAGLATRPLGLSWLRFASASSERRVSHVPKGWERFDDQELEDLMGQSELL